MGELWVNSRANGHGIGSTKGLWERCSLNATGLECNILSDLYDMICACNLQMVSYHSDSLTLELYSRLRSSHLNDSELQEK